MYRNTQGYLPEAKIAFLDEIFKSNSAILNTLLRILNERVFINNAIEYPSPLQLVIGASNEPPDANMQALYDRFLFRQWVDNLHN